MELSYYDICVLLPDGSSGAIHPHFLYQVSSDPNTAEKFIEEEISIMEGRWGKGNIISMEHREI